jgi:glycosyltransferase involved in cell wall biosynthesis
VPRTVRLSLAVITRNEEKRLADCLRSVPFADEIVVVDSESTDRTRELAAELGAKVSVHPFADFASQKNLAIERAGGEWVLLLDADERLSAPLQQEIKEAVVRAGGPDGYFLRRHNHLFGGFMRFGANGDDWQLRLLRRGRGRFEGIVHERIALRGEAGRLKSPLLHYSSQSTGEYMAKFRQYSALEAERLWKEGKRPTPYQLWLKPMLEFVYFYFIKLGFLDGFRGLKYQALSTRYLYSKYRQADRLFRERARA